IRRDPGDCPPRQRQGAAAGVRRQLHARPAGRQRQQRERPRQARAQPVPIHGAGARRRSPGRACLGRVAAITCAAPRTGGHPPPPRRDPPRRARAGRRGPGPAPPPARRRAAVLAGTSSTLNKPRIPPYHHLSMRSPRRLIAMLAPAVLLALSSSASASLILAL